MSQQEEANHETLGLLRFCVYLAVVLLIIGALLSHFAVFSSRTRDAGWQESARQLNERVQWLHGEWLMVNRPAHLFISHPGQTAQGFSMSRHGWPVSPWPAGSGSGCQQLWQLLMETADTAAMVIETRADGCLFRRGTYALYYSWQNGGISLEP